MKRLSYYLHAVAAVVLAATMSAGLASCENNDNPVGPDVPETAKVIIKEINVGGSKNGTKSYNNCKAIVLYNNSGVDATLKNFGIGVVGVANAYATNADLVDGKLTYDGQGFLPCLYGIWYLPQAITIKPYSDLVIAVNGAINHTAMTNGNNAFDLTNADVAMYDPDGEYNNATFYPKPTTVPESNWMKGIRFNTTGNSWPISTSCPAVILFEVPEGTDPANYFTQEENIWYIGGSRNSNGSNTCYKVPIEWIHDGVELFSLKAADLAKSYKRITNEVDAGYGLYTSSLGYSAYRNVDQEATEAIKDNEGKLVYGYDQAVEGTQDASGIDAAASIKNGAKIVYKDTNNSTDDFHLRATWSLK